MTSTGLEPARVTLFLGAGASAAFGFPTTNEFLTGLIAGSLNGKQRELLQAISSTLGISDIEHVLEILDQVVELDNPLFKYFDSNTVTHLSRPSIPWADFKREAASLRGSIHTELFRRYAFDPIKRKDIQTCLEGLLNSIPNEGSILDIFTTNYDSVVEEGITDSRTYVYVDGFAEQKYGQPAVWKSRSFDELPSLRDSQKIVRLYKLHGSLQWRIEKESGRFVRVHTEEKATDYSKKFGENILLYPASKRPPIAEPYGTLYSRFVESLKSAKVCVVIGFSFRDPYINTVFVNYLRSDHKNFILILSPSADICMQNLLGPLAKGILAQQILTVKESFGSSYTNSLISARVNQLLERILHT